MKSEFWQIQIQESDRYKTTFNVPFGQYEWNVMPFGLKNTPSEFQKIMNDIFNPYSKNSIVYIYDVLIFSQNIDQHFKHLQTSNQKLIFSKLELDSLVTIYIKVQSFQ